MNLEASRCMDSMMHLMILDVLGKIAISSMMKTGRKSLKMELVSMKMGMIMVPLI